MKRMKLTYSLMIALGLTGLSALPAYADDFSPPPQAVPAGTYYENNSGMAVNAQQVQPREPVYVWQGNRIDGQDARAQRIAGLPQAVQVGSVRYITGGIGDEERDALEAVKSEYDLHVTSTNTGGEFNGDTQVTVLDRNGAALLSVSAGPIFYADLPAGAYTVQATTGGRTEERKVTVGGSKPLSVYFRW